MEGGSHQRPLLPRPPGESHQTLDRGSTRSNRKRSVIGAACLNCQLRRSKCDGARPACQACVLKGTECRYDVSEGLTRAAARREKMDRMELDNSSMLEIFWYLQTQSKDDAQDFLEFVRSKEVVDVVAMRQWIKDREYTFDQDDSMEEFPSTPASPVPSIWGSASQEASDLISDPSPISRFNSEPSTSSYTSPSVQAWSENISVAMVQQAVKFFFECTGILFFGFTSEQVDRNMNQMFGDVQQPDQTSFQDIVQAAKGHEAQARIAELCGMAAVGVLYLRQSGSVEPPSAWLASYFYNLSKKLLDTSIEDNPLRAMKVCALLAMYNIVLKAVVGLAYVELGLSLGRMNGLDQLNSLPTITEDESADYNRTWRTLLLFSGWLGASLGYLKPDANINLQSLSEDYSREEEVLHREMVKITIIKTKIIQTVPDEDFVSDTAIEGLRTELKLVYEKFPDWMAVSSLNEREDGRRPLRRIVFYVHLFFLSSMQLLHRRVMGNPYSFTANGTTSGAVNNAAREGLMAAKMASRLLGLMKSEGAVMKVCWLCIFTSYTTGIILLHAAVQKVLNGVPPPAWVADITLAAICIETLEYCAEADMVALQFKETSAGFVAKVEQSS